MPGSIPTRRCRHSRTMGSCSGSRMPFCFYIAGKYPDKGLWPSDLKGQADCMRWLAWEGAHWDAESCGMVAFERGSKVVMSLGPADPAFEKRGEENWARFAGVLDGYLKGKKWLVSDKLTIADFSIGGMIPNALAVGLSIDQFPEISRWYSHLAALPGWHSDLST